MSVSTMKSQRLNTVWNNDGTLSFETDRFSTYALAYSDSKDVQPGDSNVQGGQDNTDPSKGSSPQTGDNSNITLWIAAILAACAVLIGTAVFIWKKNTADNSFKILKILDIYPLYRTVRRVFLCAKLVNGSPHRTMSQPKDTIRKINILKRTSYALFTCVRETHISRNYLKATNCCYFFF